MNVTLIKVQNGPSLDWLLLNLHVKLCGNLMRVVDIQVLT